ncbi:putative leader peptide [Streptosporangium sp. NPDC048047]
MCRFYPLVRFFPVIVWLVERLHVDLCRTSSRLCR